MKVPTPGRGSEGAPPLPPGGSDGPASPTCATRAPSARIGWPRPTHLRHQGPVPDPASETRARTPPSAAGAQVGRREEVPTSTHVHRSRLTSPPEAPASTEEKESAQRSRTRSGTVIPTASLPLTCISRLQPCEQVRSGPQRPATRPAAAKRSRDTPILARFGDSKLRRGKRLSSRSARSVLEAGYTRQDRPDDTPRRQQVRAQGTRHQTRESAAAAGKRGPRNAAGRGVSPTPAPTPRNALGPGERGLGVAETG